MKTQRATGWSDQDTATAIWKMCLTQMAETAETALRVLRTIGVRHLFR